MSNLYLIRRFYCTPVGNYIFLDKNKYKLKNKLKNTNKSKKHTSLNNILIQNNNSYKFLYNFKGIKK